MARWKARGRLPISANWTFFSLALTVEALWANIGRNCAVWKGVGHFKRKFQGEGRSSTNEFWCQKTRFPGLSRGFVCVILRLAVLIQYRRVTHTQTHTDRHAIMAISSLDMFSAHAPRLDLHVDLECQVYPKRKHNTDVSCRNRRIVVDFSQ